MLKNRFANALMMQNQQIDFMSIPVYGLLLKLCAIYGGKQICFYQKNLSEPRVFRRVLFVVAALAVTSLSIGEPCQNW